MWKMTLGLGLAAVVMANANAANKCPPLPEGMRCAAENGDPRAMYVVGREAYDKAREAGDYTEARRWAVRSKEAGFLAGKMLYKMVHMQAGDGQHKDLVEAHGWLTMAIDGGANYLVPWRRRLEGKMTNEQISAARQKANN
ncbi:MAG: hypothetical protein GKR94_17660 [Gammaproteobacteria bacterium]|nr:hypothetical protein [Gammaproteobacteria bacterium]